LVEKTINDSWKSELKKQIDESQYDENRQDDEKPAENPGYFDTLINIGVTFSKGKTLYNSFCKLKPPCSQDMRKNVIYCLGCKSCSQIYLGETQQWYPDRKYQHQYAVKNQSPTNGIAHHVVNTDHEIDWINWKFLDTATLEKEEN